MRRSRSLLVGLLVGLLTFVGLFAAQTMAAGPIAEIEPNDTCAAAQDLGALADGLTLNGTLDGVANPYPEPGQSPNIDFFRLTASADSYLLIELLGSPSEQGTLHDPYLGVLDSGCLVRAINDDNGVNFESRLLIQVPSDGIVAIAATSCCDSSLRGGGGGTGTYSLRVSAIVPIDSINGRARDAETGEPLGNGISVELLNCEGGECRSLAVAPTDTQGRFSFVHAVGQSPYPPPDPGAPPYSDTARYLPLAVGDYQVRLSAAAYEGVTTPIFSVGADERVELGDLTLIPLDQGLEVRGRLVDALSGNPIVGGQQEFAFVDLYRCGEEVCEELVAEVEPDAEGVFRFTRSNVSGGLLPGRYQVRAFVAQYQPAISKLFSIADDEVVDLGDIAVQPNRVRLSNRVGCGRIPATGGLCQYSVNVRSGQSEPLTLQVWSVIYADSANGTQSNFQPEPVRRIRLQPGQSRTVRFQVFVPRAVPAGTTFCAEVLVAENSAGGQFNPLVRSNIFCSEKSGE